MITESTRLFLREITLHDAAFIQQFVNSPKWLLHIGERNIYNAKAAEDYINILLENQQKWGFSLWVFEDKSTQIPMGLCGFLQRDYLPKPDLGYAILPEFENKGFTTEAVQACLNFGKSTLKFIEVYAITSLQNIGSQKVLEKVGFKLQKNFPANKNLENSLVFKLN